MWIFDKDEIAESSKDSEELYSDVASLADREAGALFYLEGEDRPLVMDRLLATAHTRMG